MGEVLRTEIEDKIKKAIKEDIKKYGDNIKSEEITWDDKGDYYDMVLETTIKDIERIESKSLSRFGRIRILSHYGSLSELREDGKRVYYKLRKEYPMVKRNLGVK